MNHDANDAMFRNSVFVCIAIASGLALLIPLIAMQFTSEVNWDIADFVVMGLILFGAGSSFVLVSRRLNRNRRIVIGAVFVAVFLYVWAELAVGIFTNWGS
jgi:O-antigen/teichoic acid export membrane protein